MGRIGTRTRMWMVLTLVVLAGAALVVARTQSGSGGHPGPAPAPSTATSATAAAPAGPFPDLAGMTDVSQNHHVRGVYPLATFTSPLGLHCAMWSSRGDTAALCYGQIPGTEPPANQVYAGDSGSHFDHGSPPSADKLNGKPLAAGQKVVLGDGGTLMGGDQITCGVAGDQVACELIRGYFQNRGGPTAQRHGFVLDPQSSWTF